VVHKQFIMLASAVALAAATFRILGRVFGFTPTVAIAGCLAPVLFIIVAMIHDYRKWHSISHVYLWGASATTVLVAGAFLLAMIAGGELVKGGIGSIGRVLGPLY
jgi:hypothetical protein